MANSRKRTYADSRSIRLVLKQFDVNNRLRRVDVVVISNLMDYQRPEWKALRVILDSFDPSGEVTRIELEHLKLAIDNQYNARLYGSVQELYDAEVDEEVKLYYRFKPVV